MAVSLSACGGGGGTDDAGTPPFGSGAGTISFGPGAGTPPFGSGAGGGAGAAGDGPRPEPDAAVVVSTAAIQGTVLGAASGSPLASAAVQPGGGNAISTGADGRYEQATATPNPRLLLQASLANYETLYTPIEVLGTVPAVNVLPLTAYGVTSDVTLASGGSVTDATSTASLVVPANSLVALGGGSAPATVGFRLSTVAASAGPRQLSGDFTDDQGVLLEAYGGVVVTPNAAVELAVGLSARLTIPVSSRSTQIPATAVLYRFDEANGRWVAASTATNNGSTFSGNITRFGQYMLGDAIGNPVLITGCVNDDAGTPAANVRMDAEGISYTGLAQATTNASGVFTLRARPNSRVIVAGQRGSFVTNSVAKDLSNVNVNLTPCLTVPLTNAATMRLTWGLAPSDIDSHLHTPDGAHVYYANKGGLSAAPFSSLDVDDTNGYGPEVTTIRRPKVGIYRFYLHNFSGTFSPGMTGSNTRVELNYAGRAVAFTPPIAEGTARYWHLFDLYIASDCSMTLYRYNRWRADEPQNPNSSASQPTAAECVPA